MSYRLMVSRVGLAHSFDFLFAVGFVRSDVFEGCLGSLLIDFFALILKSIMAEPGEMLPVSMQRVAEFARYADGVPEVAGKIIQAKTLEDVESLARCHGFELITVDMLKQAVHFARQSDWLRKGFGAGSDDDLFILALAVMLEP